MIKTLNDTNAIATLTVLAHPVRLAIYRFLVASGFSGLRTGDISEQLDIPIGSLTFHLRELKKVDLVISRRQGRFAYYVANPTAMRALLAYLTDQCCAPPLPSEDI